MDLMLRISLIAFTTLSAYAQSTPPEKPLLFHYDPKDETQVQILWNPTMGINRILEVAQREVIYSEDVDGDPKPNFQDWRRLVREEDGHDHTRRYAFVKDDPCSEVDFKASWADTKGKIHKDVIQTMSPLPVAKDLGAKLKLDDLSYDDANKVIKAKVSWSVDLTNFDDRKIGPVLPLVELDGCQMVFKRPVKPPSITEGGKLLLFPPEYATHKCNFTMKLSFGVFDKEIACKAKFVSSDKEALKLSLNCAKVKGLDCQKTAIDNCDIDCVPRKVFSEPHFTLDNNETNLAVKVNWVFPDVKDKPVLKYQIRTYHSWLEHKNRAFDIENVHETFLPKNKTSVELAALSVRHHAMWVVQVCAIRDKGGCDAKGKWDTIPEYGIFYYKLHDELPPWLKTNQPVAAPPPKPVAPKPAAVAPAEEKEEPTEKAENAAKEGDAEKSSEKKIPSAPKEPKPEEAKKPDSPKAPADKPKEEATATGENEKPKAASMVANGADSSAFLSYLTLLVITFLVAL